RGFRIEMGEIENQLMNHDKIKKAIVIPKDNKKGDKYLCAYVVSEEEIMPSQLRDYLSKHSPDYMVPSYFVFLERIPLTPNGKVDRKALPEPGIKAEAEYAPPKNETQQNLVKIWSQVLEIDENIISIDANFFQLGGHSLKATLMTAKIHKSLNVKLPLAEVFITPTIRELSQIIADMGEDKYISIKPLEKREYYELSSAQKRMVVAQQMDARGKSYNIPTIMVVKGEPDQEALKNTFNRLIQRHESLRTSFHLLAGTPVQVIHEEVALEIVYHQREEKDVPGIVEDFVSSFNLEKAPLMRVGLIKTPGHKYVLMVDMHHIIADGASHKALQKDFMALSAGDHPAPLKIHYKDFSQWQNRLYRTGQIKKQEKFWLEQFKDNIPGLGLPTDYPRPPARDISQGDFITFVLKKELCKRLYDVVKKTGTTSYIVLFAAYNILLSKYTKKEDIVVGTLLSGRSHADLEHVIGMFVNTLPIRNYPRKDKSFKEFLKEVKGSVLNASENQDYQFEELVAALGQQGDSSRNPLFDTVFTQETGNPTPPGGKNTSPAAIQPYAYGAKFAKFDLYFLSTVGNETINILIRYSTQLFKPSRIQKMAKYYTEILDQVTGNINMKLKDITLSHDFLTSASTVHKDDGSDFKF
ncbi:MAG: non-ribosomal peptide synthetase, partial [Candidatus Aminicenantes bacterium]